MSVGSQQRMRKAALNEADTSCIVLLPKFKPSAAKSEFAHFQIIASFVAQGVRDTTLTTFGDVAKEKAT
jgi:hypothetical protein